MEATQISGKSLEETTKYHILDIPKRVGKTINGIKTNRQLYIQYMFSLGIGSCISQIILGPLDRIRILCQTRFISPRLMFIKIIKEQGFTSLWWGNGTHILLLFQSSLVRNGVFLLISKYTGIDQFKYKVTNSNVSDNIIGVIENKENVDFLFPKKSSYLVSQSEDSLLELSSTSNLSNSNLKSNSLAFSSRSTHELMVKPTYIILSSLISIIACYPLDVVLTVISTGCNKEIIRYKDIITRVKHLNNLEYQHLYNKKSSIIYISNRINTKSLSNIRLLYKGFGISLLSLFPFMFISLNTHQILEKIQAIKIIQMGKSQLLSNNCSFLSNPFIYPVSIGIISALTGQLLLHPIDTVKRHHIIDSWWSKKVQNSRFRLKLDQSLLNSVKNLINAPNIKNLYRGSSLHLFKAILQLAILPSLYSFLSN
ncbi:carrier protein [Cryptosporidium andersoni]|uniref:Carrier protein n=1 Tax=Cryptosporidium andersoni TaxID=117008 RepID=A0A1J4MQG1_9CRYT|nr:carrier protein [Cryptosporidium andersoni]